MMEEMQQLDEKNFGRILNQNQFSLQFMAFWSIKFPMQGFYLIFDAWVVKINFLSIEISIY